jgi:uncharacterized protein DUF4430
MRRALAAVAVLAAFAAAASGCGLGPGEKTASEGSLTVTRDFGTEPIGRHNVAGVSQSDTVMRLLQRDFEVETRYGGNFVQEIDGVAGGREGGRRVDWFYYVNGIEAGTGAAERRVEPGDRIWWDHHDWGGAMRIPAVVGSFPEPFVSGNGGRKLPVRLVCLGDGGDAACDEVETRLRDAGVTDTARSVLEQSAGREVLRVLVGPWSQIRRDTAARKLEGGPEQSGVFARPTKDGDQIALLDENGGVARTLGAGGGLLAATRIEAQQPTWIVTGVDAAGVSAAAAALTGDELQDHFAIAIEKGRTVPLPVIDRAEEP